MEFTTKIDSNSSQLWSNHFMVPNEIAEYFLKKRNTRRVICNINDKLRIHCAITSDGLGQYYITINKANRKKLSLEVGDSIKTELTEDTSKYGMNCPKEMIELLNLDEEGSALFHKLTAGKQRSLLHIIDKVKSSDLRIGKSVVILNYLKENNGNLNFQELNEAFKISNHKF